MSARIYIAGPMSAASCCRCDRLAPGCSLTIPADLERTSEPWDYNYPAFHAATWHLRGLGYHVESPHEPGQVDGWGWTDYMRRGLQQMLTCDVIALLPGWHESRGAMIELRLAESLGMRTILIDHDGRPIWPEQLP